MTNLWPGHCWKCGDPVMEILEKYPRDHELAGQPRRFGSVLPGSKRTTFVRAWSGRTTDLSVCKDCEIEASDIPELNRKLLLAQRLENDPEGRRKRGIRSDNVKNERLRMQTLVLYANDPIVGALYSQSLAGVV